MTTFYLDPVNGNDASDGSSWANAWKTWASGATSASFTPAYSGYVRCEIHTLDGSTTGGIGIDDIHLAMV